MADTCTREVSAKKKKIIIMQTMKEKLNISNSCAIYIHMKCIYLPSFSALAPALAAFNLRVSYFTHFGWTYEEWVFSWVLIDEPGMSGNHASLLFPWQYSTEPFYKEGRVPILLSFSLGCFCCELGIGKGLVPGPRSFKRDRLLVFLFFFKHRANITVSCLQLLWCTFNHVSVLS